MRRDFVSFEDWVDHFGLMSLEKGASLVEACRDSPVFFARYMLGIELYAWQVKVLRCVGGGDKKVAINCARQIGKSLLVAVICLWACVFNKGFKLGVSGVERNTKVGIVSRGDDQAKKLITTVRSLIRVGDSVMKERLGDDGLSDYFSRLIDSGVNSENNKTTITFVPGLYGSESGSFIRSLPPTDAVLGYTFDVVVEDEASRIEDDIHNRAISPTGDFGYFNGRGALRVLTSTPAGCSGFYYEIFDPDERYEFHDWKRFWFGIDSIRFDDPERYIQKLKDIKVDMEKGMEWKVRQEYFGEFVAGEDNFFEGDLVDECFRIKKVPAFDGLVDFGVDFGGQTTSRTVVTVVRLSGEGVIERIECLSYGVQQDLSLVEDLQRLKMRFPNVQRVVVDDCPAGQHLIKELELGGWNVTRMSFATHKIDTYHAFRALVYKGKVATYPDSSLSGEMKALKLIPGVNHHKIRAAEGYTDDFIDSFVIACFNYLTEVEDFDSSVVSQDDFVNGLKKFSDPRYDEGVKGLGFIDPSQFLKGGM